ncbi:MAG: hypothetical protein ABW065_13670 [Solirubrobacterales bacterium]
MALLLGGALVFLAGCGGSEATATRSTSAASQQERPGPPVGHGTGTLNCQTFPFIGMGPDDWRKSSVSFGPLGMLVTDYAEGRRGEDGLLHTKIPTLVEGHRSVVLTVPSDERRRTGIEVVKPRHPVTRLRLDPCRDRRRTIWAAGIVARDRGPVTLHVSVVGGRSGAITIGSG